MLDFVYDKTRKQYEVCINGFEIAIPESYFDDDIIERTPMIVQKYTQKLNELVEFCIYSDTFKYCYPDYTAAEIKEKLNKPTIRLDKTGGLLSYCNHDLDEDHIIDIEFVGNIDSFWSVNIDG